MANLVLNLKKEYFNAIRDGSKQHEYRLTTPYWTSRIEGKEYDLLVIRLGYPRAGDSERELCFPYCGYEVQQIVHPHFGDKPVDVYAIRICR